MKKTQFKIGLLTACLISANSAFCDIASAQSCGAESSGSSSCKCSKKHCDDTGLLEVINSAASNFEAGLASMIPDGQKRKAKPTCQCAECSGTANASVHSIPIAPPVVHEKEHVHQHVPHSNVPHPKPPRTTPVPNPIQTIAPSQIPAPKPLPIPESQENPFKDDTTGIHRSVPARPASLQRSSKDAGIKYDPQARSLSPLRPMMAAHATTKSISDLPHSLATTRSTRRGTQVFTDRDAGNQLRSEFASGTEGPLDASVATQLDRAAPAVVPASTSTPLRNLRENQSSNENSSSIHTSNEPLTRPVEMFVNPLRAQ